MEGEREREKKKMENKTCIVASMARIRGTFKFCVSLALRLHENGSICVFSFN